MCVEMCSDTRVCVCVCGVGSEVAVCVRCVWWCAVARQQWLVPTVWWWWRPHVWYVW